MQTELPKIPNNHKEFLNELIPTYSKKSHLHIFSTWTNLRTWKNYGSTPVLTLLQVRQDTYDNKIQTIEIKYRPVFEENGMQNRFRDQSGSDMDYNMFNTTDIKNLFLLWWEYTLKNIKTNFPVDWFTHLTIFQISVMETLNYFDRYSNVEKVMISEILNNESILPDTIKDIFLF